MATFDMTSIDTAGVGANVIAVPTNVGNVVRTIEAILDIDAMIAAGATIADGDIFQLLEIPAESVVVAAGAEIMKSFTASCTCNIDYAGGDDIIDGALLDAAAATGRLRVYAVIADVSAAMTEAAVAQRDLL